MDIHLTPDLATLINREVESGRFASAEEMVAASLHLLMLRDQLAKGDLEHLRDEWQAGIESGEAGPINFAELRAEARSALLSRGGR